MQMSRMLVLAALAGGLFTLAAPTAAQDPEVKSTAEQEAELRASIVEDLQTAHQMAEFGMKYKSPEALIAAGSLLRKVDVVNKGDLRPIEGNPTDESGKEIKDEGANSPKLADEATRLFKAARAMSAGTKSSDAVLALIKEAELRKYEVKTRGAAQGPQQITRTLKAGDAHVWNIRFRGGETAVVGLTSTATSRMRLSIDNPNGNTIFNLVCHWANYNWNPRDTGVFKIRIHNTGNNPVTYTLRTN